jgi:hypothetical protein
MKVEFIYDPDCPNVAEARAHLLRAFAEAGISPRWVEWSRDSAEAPVYARAFGSPTLLVNGHDVAEQASAVMCIYLECVAARQPESRFAACVRAESHETVRSKT